jgi:hypothetical protein
MTALQHPAPSVVWGLPAALDPALPPDAFTVTARPDA